jgi:carboxypeptidase PM20D1
MKRILLSFATIIVVVFVVILFRTITFQSKQTEPVQLVTDIEIADDAINRLREAIRIPTISYEDRTRSDTQAIINLHEVIRQSFPLVDSLLQKTVVNRFSLLYEWKGSNASLKPALLMAHMDVVPVEKENEAEWLQPPFSGNVYQNAVWGRGTLDDKSAVFAILEAAEWLLQHGFVPQRTIYFAFGHDEEIGGTEGAQKIAELLEQKKIEAEIVLDEGMYISTGGMIPGISKPVAMIGVAEKGYLSLKLVTRIKGGHSSIPPRETSIGVLAKAIGRLQDHLMPASYTEPTRKFFEYVGPEMPFFMKMIIANQWLFERLLINAMTEFNEGSASFRTTTAPTIFQSGIKENVVPYEAMAIVNFRLLPGEHSHDVIDKVKRIIDDPRVEITPVSHINEASPVASDQTPAFRLLAKTIREVSADNVLISPSLVLGGTDSKHFYNISRNIFKYLHIRMNAEDLKRVHGTNERILTDDYKELIKFYIQLMRNLQP